MLTRLPFINLFYEMCSLIAPQYFDDGEAVLESACDNVCQWPPLCPGGTILPLLGTVFKTTIPKNNSKTVDGLQKMSIADLTTPTENEQQNSHHGYLTSQILSSVHEIDIFQSLFSVLTHIHLLWELVLIAEPIVVMGTSPSDCSMMVQSLMR